MRRTSVFISIAFFLMTMSAPALAASFQFFHSLDIFDELAEDNSGQFYYAVYGLVVSAPTPVMVSMTSPDFEPWLGAWDQEYLPTFEWQNGVNLYAETIGLVSGLVGETISFEFNASPFVFYQIATATNQYNPTPLGDYELIIETPVIPDFPEGVPFAVTIVPLPPALWVFASALGLLGWRQRRTA